MEEGNRLPKFLMNAGFYPITRNPPIVQVKPISEYLGDLLEFWELESPLDLEVWLLTVKVRKGALLVKRQLENILITWYQQPAQPSYGGASDLYFPKTWFPHYGVECEACSDQGQRKWLLALPRRLVCGYGSKAWVSLKVITSIVPEFSPLTK